MYLRRSVFSQKKIKIFTPVNQLLTGKIEKNLKIICTTHIGGAELPQLCIVDLKDKKSVKQLNLKHGL